MPELMKYPIQVTAFDALDTELSQYCQFSSGERRKTSIFSLTHLATKVRRLNKYNLAQGTDLGKSNTVDIEYQFDSILSAYQFCLRHGIQPDGAINGHKLTPNSPTLYFSVTTFFEMETCPTKRALELGAYLKFHKKSIIENGYYTVPAEISPTGCPMKRPYEWPADVE